MKILHIIPVGGSSVIQLAETLQRRDKENEHIFLVTTAFQTVLNHNMDLLRIRDLKHMPNFKRNKAIRKLLYLYKFCKSADWVVWHTFKTNNGYSPYFLYLFRNILKKSMWIPCEGEIGNYMSVAQRVLNRFVRPVNCYVQHNIAGIGINCASDRELLGEFEIIKPNVYVLPYIGSNEQREAMKLCLEKPLASIQKSNVFVQLGVSSQLGNHHLHLIKSLQDLSDCSESCLFVPFRYVLQGMPYASGSKVYMNKVRTEVKKMRCRSVFLEKCVTSEVYINHLSKMDIILLDNKESIQLGMLMCLLALKKRIFMSRESPLYKYLNTMGAGIHSLEMLEKAGSLAAAMELPGSNLPEELLYEYSAEHVVMKWRRWYESIKNL